MTQLTTKDAKIKRRKCLICHLYKYPEEHYKIPFINNRQRYICSEECWLDYIQRWKNGEVDNLL